MPTFPSDVRILRTATPIIYSDDQFVSQFDGGAIATRSKFLNRRGSVRLEYIVNHDNYLYLTDFFDEVRGATLTFDFTFPYPHTECTTTASTPVSVTTRFRHGYRTGEWVFVSGTEPGVDGARQITRVSATEFTLDGTTGTSASRVARVSRHFPTARFINTIFGPFPSLFGFGAPRDAGGKIPVILDISEV